MSAKKCRRGCAIKDSAIFFNIFTQNLGGPQHVESFGPVIDHLRKTISACGHEVTVEYGLLHSNGINLLFEGFTDEGFSQEISNLRREKGIRFGVIATELMQEEGFPYARHGISYGGTADQEAIMLSRRLDGFAEVIQFADFVWSLLPRTADYLSDHVAISEWLPFGHVAKIPSELRRSPKNFDICFFGKMTPHRKSVIDSLVDSGLQVIAVGKDFPLGFCPWPVFGSLLDQSRIALNLTLHAADDAPAGTDPRFVSSMRMVECLQRDLFVVSEDIPFDNPYKDFMESAPIDELPALCKRLLEDGRWDKLGQQKGKKFREAMDVRKICLPVIERTLTAMGLDGS